MSTRDVRWERLSELFDAAWDLPEDERSAYLASACGGDGELRRELEAMLATSGRQDGILDRPVVDFEPETDADVGDEPSHDLGPGARVGPYELLEEIGRGGMSLVFRARDARLERQVALKFLTYHRLGDDTASIRFVREAKAASGLDHPNLCTVYDIGETDDGTLYIAMAYYAGPTLDRQIASGPLGVATALRIADDIAAGLEHAHRAGIVHRDIKPSNILLTREGPTKILDFGIAKLQGGSKVTQSGTAIGTIAYMSPEQARGEAVDARTDLWALGVVLYEMLAGNPPFARPFPAMMFHAIFEEDPEPIGTLRAEAPPELDHLIARVLSKKAEDRHPTAGELRTELAAIQTSVDGRPDPSSQPYDRQMIDEAPTMVLPKKDDEG